jgi:hypothetical protein
MAKGKLDTAGMRRLIAIGVAIVLLPLILVAGLRSELVSAVIRMATAGMLYRQSTCVRTQNVGNISAMHSVALRGWARSIF